MKTLMITVIVLMLLTPLLAFGQLVEGSLDTLQFTFKRALPLPDGNVSKLGFGDDGYLWVHGEDSNTFL